MTEETASFRLSSAQEVFGLRRVAQQAAAALAFDQQDQVRLATALSELGRDRLGSPDLEVTFGLDTTAQPNALVVAFSWRGGTPPRQETLDLVARLVRVEHRAGTPRVASSSPTPSPATARGRTTPESGWPARSTPRPPPPKRTICGHRPAT